MEKQAAYIAKLIGKSKLAELSDLEAAHLQAWIAISERNRQLYEELQREAAQREAMTMIGAFREDEILARILATPQKASVQAGTSRIRLLRNWLLYAAAVLLFLSAGISWYVLSIHNGTRSELASRYGGDAAPGGNRATITLADGRTVELSDAQTGIVVGDGITYLDGSAVLSENPYTLTPSHPHTLTTPKGGTYQITLPDGSKVWLNASSTLRYPAWFDDKERIVELEGEAYFAVSEQWSVAGDRSLCEKIPFLVKTKAQIVEVLGTEFNISAYPDDPETKTTLVEGKVNVSVKGSTPDRPPTTDHRPPITLKPGEQSISRGAIIETKSVDVQQYTAWKNGDFRFSATPLEEVLRQLERWYDIDADLDEVPDRKIHGVISRSRNLSAILLTIEKTSGITFKIEGRRLRIEQ